MRPAAKRLALCAALLLLLAAATVDGAAAVRRAKRWNYDSEPSAADVCRSFSPGRTGALDAVALLRRAAGPSPPRRPVTVDKSCDTRIRPGRSPWFACYCRTLHEMAAGRNGESIIWSATGDPIYIRHPALGGMP